GAHVRRCARRDVRPHRVRGRNRRRRWGAPDPQRRDHLPVIGRPKRRACVLALAFGVACASEDPDVGASTTEGATTTGHAEGTATEADATGEPATGPEASSSSGSTGSGGVSESDDGS